MKQALKAVSFGDLFHRIHRQVILVDADVDRHEVIRKFKLSRCDFVMFSLGLNAEFSQFLIEIVHEIDDS